MPLRSQLRQKQREETVERVVIVEPRVRAKVISVGARDPRTGLYSGVGQDGTTYSLQSLSAVSPIGLTSSAVLSDSGSSVFPG